MKKTPLTRKTPLQRGGARTAVRKKKAERLSKSTRQQVFARAGGRCDCCGAALDPEAWDCHHRQLRSRGGRHTLENLVALTHACHMRWHESPNAAAARGLMVSRWDDPATEPVVRGDGAAYLPVAGRWERVKRGAA